MPVHVQWLDPEHTALLFEYVQPWTWDDMLHAREQRDAMLAEAGHSVTMVINLTELGHLPTDALGGIRRIWSRKHTRTAGIILVGLNPALRAISQIFMKVNPSATRQTRMVGTLQEAMALVEERRQAGDVVPTNV